MGVCCCSCRRPGPFDPGGERAAGKMVATIQGNLLASGAQSIAPDDKPLIRSVIGAGSKIYAAAGARVYFAKAGSKKWAQTLDAGVLVFYQSLESGILHFGLVDLDGAALTWTQEIYVGFEYHRESLETFHSFEGDNGMYGLLFAVERDAEDFYRVVSEHLAKTVGDGKTASKPGRKAKSIFRAFLFKRNSNKSDKSDKNDKTCIEEESTESDDASIRSLESKSKSASKELSHDDVSEPRDFRHLSHIGFNPEKGSFDIQNIPTEWQQVFAKAGITADQLGDRNTAQFIAGFVDSAAKRGMQVSPPKLPPKKKKPAPPPPPPPPVPSNADSRPMSKKTAPPPPPPKKKPSTMHKDTGADEVKTAPSSAARPISVAGDDRSALLASIRTAGTSILKPVSETENSSRNSSQLDSPNATNPHSALMASIRAGAPLKVVEPSPSTGNATPKQSSSPADSGEMMAAMLAKALAARSRRLGSGDSDEDSDDDRW